MPINIQIIKDMKAKLFAIAAAALAAAVPAFVPVDAGIAVPALIFLNVMASIGLGFAWFRADAALRIADQAATQATSNYVLLTNRLIKLEQQLQSPAATPALRSTMAEVTGTVGLLGGVVRELAKNVAAQNRDVADLKDTLKAGPDGGQMEEAATFADMPPAGSAEAPQPEPSLLPATRKPTEDELRRMRLVTQAFDADRIELHLQPVVALPQRKIRFYEALARLRLVDGTLLGPAEFLPFLERLGRAPEFDRRILERAMAVARHLVARGSEAIVGVNISAHAVEEPGFLWSLVGMMDATPQTLGKVVLELPQANWRRLDSDQKAALAALRERGVPLSLDRATDLNFDAKALADLGVRFLKLPADLMLAAEAGDSRHAGSELSVRDYAALLRREGIKLVVEHVEREETVPALIDLGVPLAQGFVFSAPRAVKADVLGGTAQPQPASTDSRQPPMRRAG